MDYLKKIPKDKFITLETPGSDLATEALPMRDLAFLRHLMA
jgi:hypothetical protein